MTKKRFQDIFSKQKPLIGCIHLLPLPGAPLYDGDLDAVYSVALQEAAVFECEGYDGLIIENFRDMPFYPLRIPAETIAAMTAVAREIINQVQIPIGINALRNDGESAMAIATAVKARFIRVNVHMNAVVADQGILQGLSHLTVRLRKQLFSDVLIFADVGVKHAKALVDRGLDIETRDLAERGLADAVIVSGDRTGMEARIEDLILVKGATALPILIGSGITPSNLEKYVAHADGFIVGSYVKQGGYAYNPIDPVRIRSMKESLDSCASPK
jgi:uncharacterized protein